MAFVLPEPGFEFRSDASPYSRHHRVRFMWDAMAVLTGGSSTERPCLFTSAAHALAYARARVTGDLGLAVEVLLADSGRDAERLVARVNPRCWPECAPIVYDSILQEIARSIPLRQIIRQCPYRRFVDRTDGAPANNLVGEALGRLART